MTFEEVECPIGYGGLSPHEVDLLDKIAVKMVRQGHNPETVYQSALWAIESRRAFQQGRKPRLRYRECL